MRLDSAGRRHVDLGALITLAWPLFLNSSVQAILNLTDTWFIARISTEALAAVGAVYWVLLAILILLGGIGMAVQTLAAQAFGARRSRYAGHVAWMGLWGALATAPVFLVAAWLGKPFLSVAGLTPEIAALAYEYWWPRLVGGPAAVALWAVLSFFNGIGRVRVNLVVNSIVAVANAILNEILMFHLGLGIAGAAWATTIAVTLGLAIALAIFLARDTRARYATGRTWRLRARTLRTILTLGLPTGLFIAFDIIGMALFQLMQVRLSAAEGAATQIVMQVTSISYMPAVGIGMAGTTLVGQAIGAGDKAWALRLGNVTILVCVVYMAVVGVLLGLAGPWMMPWFVAAGDADAAKVVALGCTLLWIACCYQLFDGLNLGAGFCLRGAGDARVPALLLLALSWLVFVPLTHALSFAPGQGWVDWLPQYGLGAAGGWWAAVVYVLLLGSMLFLRWRSLAWQRITLP